MNIANNPYRQADVYTELQGLNDIKRQAREDKAAALKQVAQQFESMFVTMMMKSMRDANRVFGEGNFLKSNESEFYQDMFDSQMSLSLAKGQGIGLAESLYRQLAGQIDGIEPDTAMGSANINAIQNHSKHGYPVSAPVSAPVLKAVRMVDAMVEIDRVLEENASEPSASATAPAVSPVIDPDDDEKWHQVISSSGSEFQIQEQQVLDKGADLNLAKVADRQTTGFPNARSVASPADVQVFASPEHFVTALFPIAKKIENETGMDARFMLAQSALETGWGKHMIEGEGHQVSFNLFGIKADHRWQGDSVTIVTTEFRDNTPIKQRASFRRYDSYEASFRDYVDFLKTNPRYQEATKLFAQPEALAKELQDAGYATDPEYSQKIKRIFNGDLLQSALSANPGY